MFCNEFFKNHIQVFLFFPAKKYLYLCKHNGKWERFLRKMMLRF